jgi:hypothetical protein
LAGATDRALANVQHVGNVAIAGTAAVSLAALVMAAADLRGLQQDASSGQDAGVLPTSADEPYETLAFTFFEMDRRGVFHGPHCTTNGTTLLAEYSE